MGAVSCTSDQNSSQDTQLIPKASRSWEFIWFCELYWKNTSSWLTKPFLKPFEQSISSATWGFWEVPIIALCEGFTWIRKSYQLLHSSKGFLLKDREEDEEFHMGYWKTEIPQSPKVRLLYMAWKKVGRTCLRNSCSFIFCWRMWKLYEEHIKNIAEHMKSLFFPLENHATGHNQILSYQSSKIPLILGAVEWVSRFWHQQEEQTTDCISYKLLFLALTWIFCLWIKSISILGLIYQAKLPRIFSFARAALRLLLLWTLLRECIPEQLFHSGIEQ